MTKYNMTEHISHFRFEIVTPERVVLKKEARQVSIPTTEGEITILPHHVPLVALIKAGVIEVILPDGTKEIMSVAGGLVEILYNKVVILADRAEHAAELDEQRIAEALRRAEELKEQAQQMDDVEFARLSSLIEKEVARTHAVRRWKKIKNIDN